MLELNVRRVDGVQTGAFLSGLYPCPEFNRVSAAPFQPYRPKLVILVQDTGSLVHNCGWVYALWLEPPSSLFLLEPLNEIERRFWRALANMKSEDG